MKKLSFLCAAALMFTASVSCLAQQGDDVTRDLQEMQERFEKSAPPEMLQAGRDANDELQRSGILEKALNVGASMPAFSLEDAYGKTVSSSDLLNKGPIVLVFYRGAWCPYCNLYLRGLQKHLDEITSRGANLVAVSVEPPDRSLSVLTKNKLEYTVLSDPGLKLARQFRIVYTVPGELDKVMTDRGLDLSKYNGTGKPELPLGATYVVGKDGKIEYAFLETDYKKRAAPSEIIAVLDKLKAPEK